MVWEEPDPNLKRERRRRKKMNKQENLQNIAENIQYIEPISNNN